MATYTWRSTNGGAYNDANNWDLGVVPGVQDTALFNNPYGGLISASGQANTMAFAAAAWTIYAQLSASVVNITSGVTLINGGVAQLAATSSLSVGGAAALNVFGGGTVASTGTGTIGAATLNLQSRGIANFSGALTLGASGATTALIDAALLNVGGVLGLGASGGSAVLTVQDGGLVTVAAARDDTTNYLQLGTALGTSGTIKVDGASSLLIMTQDSAGVGYGGSGELDITNGGTARFNSGNNALNPALVLGVLRYSGGVVTVNGSTSSIVVSGSVVVGKAGTGYMLVSGGASVTSSAVVAAQAALSVGAAAFGTGTLLVQGSGTQFVASGAAVIGGDNRGSGFSAGGTGTVSVTGGALLQTYTMTVMPGSSVTVDGSSQENVAGDLTLYGALNSSGTLSVSGTVNGSGTLVLGGGYAGVGALNQTNVAFTAPNTTLRVTSLIGTSTVSGMQIGDKIDLAGTVASISGNTVLTSSGSLALSGAGPFTTSSDGNGGTYVTLGVATVGVFRFFDSNYGTHFFSASSSEKNTIVATRPDLVYEGVGLESVDPSANDPNASPVYRFFDLSYGTHFFTASASERDTVIATRADLAYEGVGFLEHTAQQPGDVAVYRFFDTRFGTHFYTADANERATIVATRTDLIDEGIGFYAPGS